MSLPNAPRIAVLVPCYNEAITVAKVVEDFRAALPDAQICVFDNNSRDDTGAIARAHGAHVQRVTLQGKGHVVRRLFADVEADIYLMVDGDDTYHAASAPALIECLRQVFGRPCQDILSGRGRRLREKVTLGRRERKMLAYPRHSAPL